MPYDRDERFPDSLAHARRTPRLPVREGGDQLPGLFRCFLLGKVTGAGHGALSGVHHLSSPPSVRVGINVAAAFVFSLQ